MIFRILSVLVILLALAATFFFGNSAGEREAAPMPSAAPTEAGYSARDAEIVETGPDGKPRYRLEADRIDQHPRAGSVSLVHVTMHYRTELGAHWRLRAERGELPEDARTVELEGRVTVDGPLGADDSGPGAFVLTTERLDVDTLAQIVTTRDPVTVLWSGERLNSVGLWGNLKDQRLRLTSSVHGRFAPK